MFKAPTLRCYDEHMKAAAFIFLLACTYSLRAQDTCPSVVFQSVASVVLGETGSTSAYTGLVRQDDGSFSGLRYSGTTPYRLLGTTPNFDRAFYSCFGFPRRSRGTSPVSALTANPPGSTARIVRYAALGSNGSQYAILGTDTRFFRTGLAIGYLNRDFTPRNQVNVEIGPGPEALTTGDFNNDQLQDAVVFSSGTNFSNASIAFLRGNADGSFAAPVINNLGGGFIGGTAIDLNKDSRLDLIVVTQINSPYTVRLHILLNQGTGAFTATTQTLSDVCASPVAGDFNRDGNADVVCSDSDRNLVAFAGNGDGTLRQSVKVNIGIPARDMAAGDLNGDGNLDIATSTRNGAGALAVLLGNGALGFPTQYRYAGQYNAESTIITDFDADGKLDVVQGAGEANVLSFQATSLRLGVFFGRGDGTLEAAPAFRIPAGGNAEPLAADFNGDSRVDIAFLAGNGTFHLYTSVAGGGYAAIDSASLISGQVSGVESVAVADFNGDSRPDLAFVDPRAGLFVALNSGAGRFPNITRVETANDYVHVSAADLNGDGRADLFVSNNGGSSNSNAGNVAVFTNSGSGTFTKTSTLTPGAKPGRAYLRDLNGDNRPELVVVLNGLDPFAATTASPGGIAIYVGNASGTFGTPAVLTPGRNPGELSIGDVNGDGRPDLVLQAREGQFSDRVVVLLNNGGNSFAAPRFLATAFGPKRPLLADLNGDSQLDIVISHCCGDTYLGYYLNLGNGSFAPESFLETAVSPGAITVADLDSDAKVDVLAADGQFSSEKSIYLFRNASNRAASAVAVSAASFNGARLAAGSIISLFGSNLASGLLVNSESVPPEELGGVVVTVRDQLGAERKAQLFFVSPTQVNALLPAETPSGPATISIKTSSGSLANAAITVVDFSPGLFAATSDGLAAANLLRIASDGTQSFEPVVEVNGAGQIVARPIDLGPATDQVFLLLYGTGIRGRGSSPTNSVSIAGIAQQIQYAGAQGEFIGLDQVNVRLNRNLAGRGLVEIKLTQNFSVESNAIKVNIR